MISWQMRYYRMSKKALGKGIGALIKELDTSEDSAGVVNVPLASIKFNPNQPRRDFAEEGLRELAESIRQKGVIQPILVQSGEGGTYTVVAGERRLRAAKLAGLETIPVLVKEYTPEERIEIALIENVQREDLSPVDEALAYKRLGDVADLNQEEIAKRVGKNRSTVANSLRLLKLPEKMLKALESGRITPGHGRAILAVVNPSEQSLLFDRIIQQDLSVRQAEAVASDLSRGKRSQMKKVQSREKAAASPEIRDAEQKLIGLLGTKVKLVGTIEKGRIEVSYFTQDDLERLIELMEERVADWHPNL